MFVFLRAFACRRRMRYVGCRPKDTPLALSVRTNSAQQAGYCESGTDQCGHDELLTGATTVAGFRNRRTKIYVFMQGKACQDACGRRRRRPCRTSVQHGQTGLPHAMDRSAATNPNERQKVAFAAIKRKQENRYNQVEPFYTEEFLCNTDILTTRAESM